MNFTDLFIRKPVVATVAARGTQTVVRLPAGFVMNAGDVLELVLA